MRQAWDFRDWFVVVLHAIAWLTGTVYLYLHPDSTNFITWATFSGTVSSAYHWLVIHDSKTQDAPP